MKYFFITNFIINKDNDTCIIHYLNIHIQAWRNSYAEHTSSQVLCDRNSQIRRFHICLFALSGYQYDGTMFGT